MLELFLYCWRSFTL